MRRRARVWIDEAMSTFQPSICCQRVQRSTGWTYHAANYQARLIQVMKAADVRNKASLLSQKTYDWIDLLKGLREGSLSQK
jgi:hypothetical protein